MGWSNQRLGIQADNFHTGAKQRGKEKTSSASSQTLAFFLHVIDSFPGPRVLHLQKRCMFKHLPVIPAVCLFLHSPLSSPRLRCQGSAPCFLTYLLCNFGKLTKESDPDPHIQEANSHLFCFFACPEVCKPCQYRPAWSHAKARNTRCLVTSLTHAKRIGGGST